MHLIHVVVSAAVTVSTAGISYVALNPAKLENQARAVAAQATCRTVDTAIVAFVGVNGRAPAGVAELAGYVDGDITAYSVVGGRAYGPGC